MNCNSLVQVNRLSMATVYNDLQNLPQMYLQPFVTYTACVYTMVIPSINHLLIFIKYLYMNFNIKCDWIIDARRNLNSPPQTPFVTHKSQYSTAQT